MIRLLLAAAIGLGIGGFIVMSVGPSGAGTWSLVTASIVAAVALVLLAFGRSLRGGAFVAHADVDAAVAARRLGRARIDAVSQTGTQINDQPLCELDVVVQPLHGAAYATTTRRIIPLVELALYSPGSEHDVAMLIDDGPEIAFVLDGLSPRERETLRVPNRASVPVREIDPHTRIVNGRRRRPFFGAGKKGRGLRLVAYVIVAALGFTAAVLPYRVAVVQALESIPQGRLYADMRTPEPLSEAMRALREEIGHDQRISVVITDQVVVVEAPVRVGERATDRWTYRRGSVEHGGASTSQPQLAEEAFDVSVVDWSAIWPTLQQAASMSERTLTADTSISLRRGADSDIQSPTFARSVAEPRMTFAIRDDYSSTWFEARIDGSELHITSTG